MVPGAETFHACSDPASGVGEALGLSGKNGHPRVSRRVWRKLYEPEYGGYVAAHPGKFSQDKRYQLHLLGVEPGFGRYRWYPAKRLEDGQSSQDGYFERLSMAHAG